jgi:hypothetical protein
MRADVAAWLARARADAEARGLAPLVPLLETLARSTAALRDAPIARAAGAAYDPAATGPDNPATRDARDAAE